MLQAQFPPRTLATPAPRADALPRRRIDVPAALLAGLAATTGAFILLQVLATTVYDEPFWKLFRLVAAMVRGPGVLEPDDEFDAAVMAIGMLLFVALGVLYSLALSFLVFDSPRRYAAVMGAAFGIALYFANFYGFTAIFPWFASHRTFDTLVVHALFGVIVARGYWALRRPSAR